MLHLFEAVPLKRCMNGHPATLPQHCEMLVFVHEAVQIVWLHDGNVINLNWHGLYFFFNPTTV